MRPTALFGVAVVVILTAGCAGPRTQRSLPTEDVRLTGPDYTLTITIAAAYTGFCGPITYVLPIRLTQHRTTHGRSWRDADQ